MNTIAKPDGAAVPARDTRGHALFKRFPLVGRALLSVGTVPTPYHVYDGHGLFIGGHADLAATRALLAPEQVVPVRTEDGRALMGLWVFDFSDASLGPHHELQWSVFVSTAELAPVTARPLGLLELMLTRPEVQMLCHGLWNNTPVAVAYNRELLALDARLSDSTMAHDGDTLRFRVADLALRAPLVEGSIERPRRASLRAGWALLRHLGLRRLGELAWQPWIRMPVVHTVSPTWQRNAPADSFTKAESSMLRFFDPQKDRLDVLEPRYRALQFESLFVQAMSGFKFVYLFPQ